MSVPERKKFREEPYFSATAVTPHDTNDIAQTRALFIGTGGAVKVDMADGNTVTFGNIPNGTTVDISVTRVYNTGTAASNIVALY